MNTNKFEMIFRDVMILILYWGETLNMAPTVHPAIKICYNAGFAIWGIVTLLDIFNAED
jgi:hypothetical protein